MRIENNTGDRIVIEDGEELKVKRSLVWIDREREIDYITIDRVEGGNITRKTDDESVKTNSKEEEVEISDEVREMIKASSVLQEKRGGSEKATDYINVQIEGTQCPSCSRDDFDDKKAVRSHHWRVHGKVIRSWEYPCPKDGCDGGSNSMKGLKQHYTRTHGEKYDDVYGDKEEPEFYCHYSEDGERCDHPCKNLRGLKIHWGKEHKDKDFYPPDEIESD